MTAIKGSVTVQHTVSAGWDLSSFFFIWFLLWIPVGFWTVGTSGRCFTSLASPGSVGCPAFFRGSVPAVPASASSRSPGRILSQASSRPREMLRRRKFPSGPTAQHIRHLPDLTICQIASAILSDRIRHSAALTALPHSLHCLSRRLRYVLALCQETQPTAPLRTHVLALCQEMPPRTDSPPDTYPAALPGAPPGRFPAPGSPGSAIRPVPVFRW